MTTITSTGTDPALIGGNQTRAKQQAESASFLTDTATPGASAESTANQDTIEISSRAQKIQKLNEEFFSGDPRSFKITPDFILRLEEYGLITADEANSLGGSSAAISPSGASTVSELSIFIESFTDDVRKIDPDNGIIDILQQAQVVLENFNNPTESSLSINIPQIIEQLQSYIDTSTEQLPEADQQSFDQLVLALGIVRVLTPGANTTAEIDSYLAINKL